jgi:hypothetical protein
MTIAISKRKKYLSWFVLALVGLSAVRCVMESNERPRRDVQQFEQEIATDLPPGTHRDAVKEWVSARSSWHGWITLLHDGPVFSASTTGLLGSSFGQGPLLSASALISFGRTNFLGRIIGLGAHVPKSYGEIRLYFYFDGNGRLEKSSVHLFIPSL